MQEAVCITCEAPPVMRCFFAGIEEYIWTVEIMGVTLTCVSSSEMSCMMSGDVVGDTGASTAPIYHWVRLIGCEGDRMTG